MVATIFSFSACGGAIDPALAEEEEQTRRWVADIEQYRAHVLQWHPRFAYRRIADWYENIEIRQAFEESINELTANAANLSDFEIQVELQRSTAILRDNHFFFTAFAGYNAALRVLRYPLVFGWFADGVYLYQAHRDFEHALNKRVVAVNGVSIDDVFRDFSLFWSVENIYDARYQFTTHLNAVKVLQSLGITGDDEHTTYTLMGSNNEEVSITVTESNRWERLYTTLRWLPPANVTDNRAEGNLPLFRQNFRANLWHEFVEDYGILYISIRGWVPDVQNVFRRAVENTFNENDVRAVIVDARSNPGGDANQFNDLFNMFAQRLLPESFFYFVNEGSNSGSLGAALFLENIGAVIVGQPLAQNANFYWFGNNISRAFLYYSRLEVFPPPTFFSSQTFFGRESGDGIFRPHVLIDYTIDDWVNNRDPLFDYVIGRITN